VQNAPCLQKTFDATRSSRSGDPAKPGALIIDIQSNEGMSAEDGQNFLNELASSLKTLRDNHIPVTWVVMGDRNHLFEPGVRSMDDFAAMGFDTADPVFHEFLKNHGPRADEAVYCKFYKSAFMQPEDYAGNPALQEVVREDYRKDIEVVLPRPGDFAGLSLTEYLHGQGIGKALIMGSMSTHCVSETAAGAIVKGFDAAICTDLVVSWEEDEDQVDPRTSHRVWRDSAVDHEDRIRARLRQITADPRRELTDAEKTAIREMEFSGVQDIVPASLPASKPVPGAPPGMR